ncbi:GGDEF domain-containing protein [Acidovorax sp. SRB_24]|uniref:GGDEF domain-containing protein n=1 Tax=Acidovorax sp. SRB_24 TaxID=1962700 RepID=UPI00145E18A5|nr:GGDEF domain-containing protein [Acidovorax sp. SRB_24]NMM76513.1 GGDEF domain-containing protein [Acidovorax sp. SRB_24]
MTHLLQNLVEMTGHRDHLRLEASVMATLHKLTSVVEVRALEVFQREGEACLRPRSWMENGQWVSTEAEAQADARRQPLTHFPALQACFEARTEHARSAPQKGRYVVWLPVWVHDQVTSCLEVSQSRPISAHRLDVLMGIFNVYKNYQSLLDYSERDALTGLFNRKTFDEQFARHASCGDERARAPQSAPGAPAALPEGGGNREPLRQWLAVIDIDHFKQVNDRFGHLYGDEVLILMANLLRSSFRSHDRIFRFGGEEFVVLLRATTLETAHKVFNRFRQTVQDHHFPQVGQITVSVGFTASASGSPVEILGQADQALYFSKENGRNQVRFYDDLVASGHLQSRISHEDMELF